MAVAECVRVGLCKGLKRALGSGACKDFANFLQKWRAFALQFAPIGLGRVI